jgi:hypothetical protein
MRPFMQRDRTVLEVIELCKNNLKPVCPAGEALRAELESFKDPSKEKVVLAIYKTYKEGSKPSDLKFNLFMVLITALKIEIPQPALGL